MDQIQSGIPGFVPTWKGKPTTKEYNATTVFVDHASKWIFLNLHESTGAEEAVNAKLCFERAIESCGVKAKQFRTDNGVFASKDFKNAVEALNQHVSFCGPYAHHQNGVAERAIRSITEKARKILLNAMSQWPDVVKVELWTMALRYAVDIHNATPSENGLSPEDIFTGQKLDSRLQDFHTFGSPVFVLHPILANGKQLPKWKPRSRMGMYLGSSPHHARTVPLVLNLRSGLVLPQVAFALSAPHTQKAAGWLCFGTGRLLA